MICRRSSETSVNKLLNDGHALMALSSSPKPIIVKAGNQFSGYVSNYTHNQKYKKITFAFILIESYFIFKVKKFNFSFQFKKRGRFNFFLCIRNKIVLYSWTSYRYPEPTYE